jgi:nicotinate-nucleotide adenylyltransferase
MRTGLFGGTFDPIHNGHIGLAENIIKHNLVDRIIFIPAARPPHKPEMPVTHFFHRANMIRVAIEGKSYFEMSAIEGKSPFLPSYTYDTVKWFSLRYPEDSFYLVIGEDSLAHIHTWHRAKELVKVCEIITYPRPNENITLEKLKRYWTSELAERLFKTILPLPVYDISATQIRKSGTRKEGLKILMPQGVCDYIEKHTLYS